MKLPTLYNIDENGNVRTWYIEVEGPQYRVVSGVEGGKQVVSSWKDAKPKNVGRANATTAEEQALLEAESKYTKKKDQKYSETRETASRTNIVQVMLSEKWKDLQDKISPTQEVWVQPKLDGIRCLATPTGLFSRNGKPVVSSPHILEAMRTVFEVFPDCLWDGELYNHEYCDNFNELTSLINQKKPVDEDFARSEEKVQFHVYDMIPLKHPTAGYQRRYEMIKNMIPLTTSGCVRQVETHYTTIEKMDSLYSQFLEDRYEGMMIRIDGPYEFKRSKRLIKRKEFFDAEYPVLRIEEGQGNWKGYAKVVYCIDPVTKEEFKAGIKGNQAFTKDLLERARNGQTPKTTTVRSPNLTPDGVPRFGIAVAFYDDERDV